VYGGVEVLSILLRLLFLWRKHFTYDCDVCHLWHGYASKK